MTEENNPPVINGSQESVDDVVLWTALLVINDDKSPSVGLSLTQRAALRRDKLKDLNRISKLELAIDLISQEYNVDMRRYKYLRLKEKS